MIPRRLKTKFLAWRESCFLKKHHCRTRKEYDRKYDSDYVPRATQIKNYYQGYKYIHCFENHSNYVYTRIYEYGPGGYRDGFHVICDWCEEHLTGKWRYDILRVMRAPSTGNEWAINELGGGDHWFFAFQSEEDYFMFRLQWGN
jgi:hypothetical protein